MIQVVFLIPTTMVRFVMLSRVWVCACVRGRKKKFSNTFNKTFNHHILKHPNPRHNNLPNETCLVYHNKPRKEVLGC